MKAHFKTLIVGAGGGGIASALLAVLRGEQVTLLESHSALGGCASWFRRGPYIFDAGATTLSGVGNGEPLGELFHLLGRRPELYAADPGIVFHLSNGKVIRYHRNFELWMKELELHFPFLNHRTFWEAVRKINSKSWSLLRDVKTFPFTSLEDLGDILKHPKYVTLVPHLMISTDHALKKYELDHPEYKELVDGILLISAQAISENIPFLVGAMALSYPAETYAPINGMKGLMEFFESELLSRGVELRKRTKVKKIQKLSVLTDKNEELTADRLIVNLPLWNLASMYEGEKKDIFMQESHERPGSWGAFTLYFGIKSEFKELYQQVHLKDSLIKNYFVSFSVPGDNRAPSGHQAVSISTHVDAKNFAPREELTSIIMTDFLKRFDVQEVFHLTNGTPKTFERYTGRMNGFVGGLPFLFGKNPLKLLSPLTAERSIYRVGDTVFPGQGLCGVISGALQLHKRLLAKEN